jgi:hypothetical protein
MSAETKCVRYCAKSDNVLGAIKAAVQLTLSRLCMIFKSMSSYSELTTRSELGVDLGASPLRSKSSPLFSQRSNLG